MDSFSKNSKKFIVYTHILNAVFMSYIFYSPCHVCFHVQCLNPIKDIQALWR